LPIQRHTIVASHYLFGLIVTILIDGIAMLIIGVGTIARFNPVRDAQSFWGILLFGTGLVLFQIMLSFPIMIFLGYQRAPLAAYLPVTLILVI
ncbi:ABC-2 transporter permease, partial [Lacticaseibacillus paracasei]